MSGVIEYGKHFPALGSAHGFGIYDGLCKVDYLMGSPSLIPEIREITIFGRPIGLAAGRAYLCFQVKDGCTWDLYAKESGLAKYQFTQETIDVLHRFYFYKLPFDVSSFLDVTKSPFCFS